MTLYAPLLAAAPAQLTREIFGNVPAWAQWLFYVLALAAVGVWAYGLLRRARLWRRGRHVGVSLRSKFRRGEDSHSAVSEKLPYVAVRRLVRDVLLQRRVWGRGAASLAHVLLFSGFLMLLIGTTLIATLDERNYIIKE